LIERGYENDSNRKNVEANRKTTTITAVPIDATSNVELLTTRMSATFQREKQNINKPNKRFARLLGLSRITIMTRDMFIANASSDGRE